MNDNEILTELRKLNEIAKSNGDVPISCIIMKDNTVISKAYNMRVKLNDPTAHAEIIAIKKAAKKLKTWNLKGCIIYVTLHPCNMCLEVIKESRIKEIIYILSTEKKVSGNIKMNQMNIIEKDDFSKELKGFFVNKR